MTEQELIAKFYESIKGSSESFVAWKRRSTNDSLLVIYKINNQHYMFVYGYSLPWEDIDAYGDKIFYGDDSDVLNVLTDNFAMPNMFSDGTGYFRFHPDYYGRFLAEFELEYIPVTSFKSLAFSQNKFI